MEITHKPSEPFYKIKKINQLVFCLGIVLGFLGIGIIITGMAPSRVPMLIPNLILIVGMLAIVISEHYLNHQNHQNHQ